jgi:hypothetical protein
MAGELGGTGNRNFLSVSHTFGRIFGHIFGLLFAAFLATVNSYAL